MRADVDGIIRTQPIETPIESNGGSHAPARVAIEEFDWNKWLNSWLDHERSVMMRWFTKQLERLADELSDALVPRLKQSELEVARLSGMVDCLRGRGVPGLPRVRGTYCATETYVALDIVALNGSSFIAREDNPGPCPGDGWQLLASAGSRGPRGARGLQGDRGVDGAALASVSFDSKRMSFATRLSDGAPGPEISLKHVFAGVELDAASYSVVVKLLDGSEMKFSLRGLFAQFFDEVKGRRRMVEPAADARHGASAAALSVLARPNARDFAERNVMEYWTWVTTSVCLDVEGPDDVAPFFGFVGDELAELGGREREWRVTEIS
jgi:hypothetical protein